MPGLITHRPSKPSRTPRTYGWSPAFSLRQPRPEPRTGWEGVRPQRRRYTSFPSTMVAATGTCGMFCTGTWYRFSSSMTEIRTVADPQRAAPPGFAAGHGRPYGVRSQRFVQRQHLVRAVRRVRLKPVRIAAAPAGGRFRARGAVCILGGSDPPTRQGGVDPRQHRETGVAQVQTEGHVGAERQRRAGVGQRPIRRRIRHPRAPVLGQRWRGPPPRGPAAWTRPPRAGQSGPCRSDPPTGRVRCGAAAGPPWSPRPPPRSAPP